jgi:hypothetical protein
MEQEGNERRQLGRVDLTHDIPIYLGTKLRRSCTERQRLEATIQQQTESVRSDGTNEKETQRSVLVFMQLFSTLTSHLLSFARFRPLPPAKEWEDAQSSG